jgi:hypothetical protein
VREGACIGGATMPQPWTLRLISLNITKVCVTEVCVYYCRTYYKAVRVWVPCTSYTKEALTRLHLSFSVCVFITAGPSTKMFTWGGGGYGRTCATRDDEPRPVWTSLPITH